MDGSGPRVALVSSSYFPDIGGVEQHTAQVARELLGRGYAVEVWTVDRGRASVRTQVQGVTVRYLPTPLPTLSPRGVVSFLRKVPSAFREWAWARRDFHPDVLHVHCFGPNGVYAEALGRLSRIPRVVSSHGETYMDDHDVYGRSLVLRTALRAALRGARAVTACSPEVAADLRARFDAGEVRIVPNGVTTPASGPREPRAERRVILAAGRLEHNKGFDLLIEALPLLSEHVGLDIVGSGSQEEALRSRARELGLEERVRFLGPTSPSGVLQAMADADVVVVPSRKEPFGIVVLEAWAAGTPVVATSVAGPASFVTDGQDGLLVDPRDPRALAGALQRVLEDDGLWRSLASGGRRTVRRYTWSAVVDEYVTTYPGPDRPTPV
ncbi:glycosyltransferase family 1 protein [Ornithinimicrobium humiphilum]|uniref:D-inositol 3-phosphate glycosyltransferase n=1 Tax=Ornithinimicrobium humiphilum TaxID=125288 RepID=A0A543KJM1_9MICO|nr:glycosyltransferase family 4 protein [Ornithinimicrobium humiphilum]TQM95280.1 glycosyltransferase involved in cell wall biosynthesis [Ornithinimicrobium humiphilum]